MSNLFRLFVSTVIAALILPNTIFAAGEYRHAHPTQLILTETTSLYDKNDDSTRISATISPQTVNVTDAWIYTRNWYEIDTWLGKKWIYAPTAIPHEPNYGKRKIQLYDNFYLHDGPFNNQVTEAVISPQVVEAIDSANSFYKISTWLGDKWIKLPPLENRYAMVNISDIAKVDQKVDLSSATEMRQTPSLGSKVLGALAPQTVQAFEKIDNWYHIKSSWVGDAWVKVDNFKPVSWSGMQVIKVDSVVNLTKETEMFPIPVSGYSMGKLAPQQVKVFEKLEDSWYHIHTWMGDAWIINN